MPFATFESSPNTASTRRVPRNATSWKSYVVPGDRPKTVQVRLAPIAAPATGDAQLSRPTPRADPHAIDPTA